MHPLNLLAGIGNLGNKYYAFRHGLSTPNQREVICSNPIEGRLPRNGLVEEGRRQVRQSVESAVQAGWLDSHTIILSSEFSRVRESTELAREILEADRVIVDPRLNERYFGKYDRQSNSNYYKVWELDAIDPNHCRMNVENVSTVLFRFTDLIRDCEENFEDQTILLGSSGDTLQIGQTAFEGISAALHRSLPHLQTAEIRRLVLKTLSH